MATKKIPAKNEKNTPPPPKVDPGDIVERDGIRAKTNERGHVVVLCRKANGPHYPGDVYGLLPDAAFRDLADGLVYLHALSVVDPPAGDDDAEDDPPAPKDQGATGGHPSA